MSICVPLATVRAVIAALPPGHTALADKLQALVTEALSPHARALAREARVEYGSDDVEIGDVVSLARTDNGTWVAAWVWVADDATDGN